VFTTAHVEHACGRDYTEGHDSMTCAVRDRQASLLHARIWCISWCIVQWIVPQHGHELGCILILVSWPKRAGNRSENVPSAPGFPLFRRQETRARSAQGVGTPSMLRDRCRQEGWATRLNHNPLINCKIVISKEAASFLIVIELGKAVSTQHSAISQSQKAKPCRG
jgi:hypothetical protein